jgi:hypothetical protein
VAKVEKKLKLDEVLEREMSLYVLENSMVTAMNSTNRKMDELQRDYAELQRDYAELERHCEAISKSRIWRYTRGYRQVGSWVKSCLESFAVGRLVLRLLRAVIR